MSTKFVVTGITWKNNTVPYQCYGESTKASHIELESTGRFPKVRVFGSEEGGVRERRIWSSELKKGGMFS